MLHLYFIHTYILDYLTQYSFSHHYREADKRAAALTRGESQGRSQDVQHVDSNNNNQDPAHKQNNSHKHDAAQRLDHAHKNAHTHRLTLAGITKDPNTSSNGGPGPSEDKENHGLAPAASMAGVKDQQQNTVRISLDQFQTQQNVKPSHTMADFGRRRKKSPAPPLAVLGPTSFSSPSVPSVARYPGGGLGNHAYQYQRRERKRVGFRGWTVK